MKKIVEELHPEDRFYPLGDKHPESRGIFDESFKAVYHGKIRRPKKGEWYLSGAIPAAYKAHSNLNSQYPIVTIVKVEWLKYARIIETLKY